MELAIEEEDRLIVENEVTMASTSIKEDESSTVDETAIAAIEALVQIGEQTAELSLRTGSPTEDETMEAAGEEDLKIGEDEPLASSSIDEKALFEPSLTRTRTTTDDETMEAAKALVEPPIMTKTALKLETAEVAGDETVEASTKEDEQIISSGPPKASLVTQDLDDPEAEKNRLVILDSDQSMEEEAVALDNKSGDTLEVGQLGPPPLRLFPPTPVVDPETRFVMSPSSKKQWFRGFLEKGLSQDYLDAVIEIVLDFKRCDYRLVHRILPDVKDPEYQQVTDATLAGSVYLIVFGFPSCHKDRLYSEEDCLRCVHDSGPPDVANDFLQVQSTKLSKTLAASFQYSMYAALMHKYSSFMDMWLAVDHVQFYQSWVSRSIGSYSPNIFLLPLDYTQSNVEEMFWPIYKNTACAYQEPFMRNMWKHVHPASFLRNKKNKRELRRETWRKDPSGDSTFVTTKDTRPKDVDPIAPWDYDIFKCKLICFCANNKAHFGLFAALNPGKLVHGNKSKKLECALASLDSISGRQSPLPRDTRWLDYTYFLLNVCYDILTWVAEQDESDITSLAEPELEVIFHTCMSETRREAGGFFNRSNMRPERLPSAKQQRDGYNCGVYASLNWSMFVEVERDQSSLWDSINTLDDLDTSIVKPFWERQQNDQNRLIHFRYKLCRLMEYFLWKHVSKKDRSYIAIGRHPLPPDWKYPKKLPVGFHYPPCADGPIPLAYQEVADETDAPAVDENRLPPERVQVDHYGFSIPNDCSDLSDTSEENLMSLGADWVKDLKKRCEWDKYVILPSVDLTGETKKNLQLCKKAFNTWLNKNNKLSRLNFEKRKKLFDKSWAAYEEHLANTPYKDKPNKKRKQAPLPTTKSPGKTPNMDLDEGLVDTSDDTDEEDCAKAKTRSALERKRLGKTEKRKLELLAQKTEAERVQRKEDQAQKRKAKLGADELTKIRKAEALAKLPQDQQDIEKSLEILPQVFKKGAGRNLIQRVNNEIATFFPVTERTELTKKEVTQLAKIRYMRKDLNIGYLMNQYEALQMIPIPGKKAKKTVRVERLNPGWMRERFTEKFLQLVRTVSKRRSTQYKWIHVPVGEARVEDKAPTEITTNVHVQYPQNDHQTCLFKSVASAMHYLLKKDLASALSSIATKYVDIPVTDQLNELCSVVEEKQDDVLVTKWLTKKRVKKFHFNHTRNDRWVLTIIPLGHDGGIGHAISIVGDYIFDSTQTHALKFSKVALDWCCANDRGFQGVYMAVSFAFRKHITFDI